MTAATAPASVDLDDEDLERVVDLDGLGEEQDKRDLDWSTVLKRTFEAYIRGERPNMYGEWIEW